MTSAMTGATISVIMPCFNRAETVATSIESVLAQSFTNWELIIVDDGSTDRSLQTVRAYSDHRISVYPQTNQGVCAARNTGLKQATGTFIAFLDADDTWHPDCLTKLHDTLVSSNARLAYCGWQNIGLPGDQGEPFVPPDYETPEKFATLFESCRWPIHACLTYRDDIFAAGLFNESLETSEDYLLWLNIACDNPITRVAEVLAFYHFHDGNQATKNKAKTAINHWRAQNIFLQHHREIKRFLGRKQLRHLMHSELRTRGLTCYWKRDLTNARIIFRHTMRRGYGSLNDWKYMLPSLLPYSLHRKLIAMLEKQT